MKRTEELRKELRDLLQSAKDSGAVKTQAEFARMVGYNPANMSSLLSGNLPVSERAMDNIRNALTAKNITAGGNVINEQKNFAQHGDDISGKLIDEMRAQRELYARQLDAQAEIIKNLSSALSRK